MKKEQLQVGKKFKIGDFDKYLKLYPNSDIDFSTYSGMKGTIVKIIDNNYALMAVPNKMDYGKWPLEQVPVKQLESISFGRKIQ